MAEVGQNFVRWTWNAVEGATGYEAAPYLASEPEAERDILYVEEPSVRVDGFESGSGIWIHVRAVSQTAGGRAVGEWSHRVFAETWAEPRECTDERAQALAYGSVPPVLVEEWDGRPFRFYWDAAIPESERADAEHFFDVVERLSGRIREQIGYSLIEVEGWIDENDRGFRIGHTDVRDCDGVRPGGIVATVIPELVPVRNLVIARARPACAVLYWTRNDIDTTLDGVMAHELFHLFGFTHSPESTHPSQTPPGVGYPMTVHLTNQYTDPRELGPTSHDIDALRCIFPKD